jgi:hypothetical protein
METDRAIGITEGYVTVQIYDRKIDTLFRLTWL